ncbi:MAG: hypothetical protein Q7J67_00180 [bacterium]|nr:hypothetical protein [bacterium]
MDKNQEFILEKIKYGLANKYPPETMSKKDVERLNWDADNYSKVPWEEWSEWSRKILRFAQEAFTSGKPLRFPTRIITLFLSSRRNWDNANSFDHHRDILYRQV